MLPIVGVTAVAAAPAPAGAVVHTVTSGESLYSIAAADGVSVSQLAAANGLSTSSRLLTGANLIIPSRSGRTFSSRVGAAVSSSTAVDGDGDHDNDMSDSGATAPATSRAGSATGGYVVSPGDSLWAIAARSGTTVASLAAANGINPSAPLLPGKVLRVSSAPVAAVTPSGVTAPVGPPYPTQETMNATQIGQIGANTGATWSLTDAVAWQESGFRNYAVAPDGGVGIMQIMPKTWRWIQGSLNTGAPLNPASAADNVRAGATLLHWLLGQTGGDPALAAAGYNQGLQSVRRSGMLPSVKRYVRNVMALRTRFGGG
jgi:LysM repeat protein